MEWALPAEMLVPTRRWITDFVRESERLRLISHSKNGHGERTG